MTIELRTLPNEPCLTVRSKRPIKPARISSFQPFTRTPLRIACIQCEASAPSELSAFYLGIGSTCFNSRVCLGRTNLRCAFHTETTRMTKSGLTGYGNLRTSTVVHPVADHFRPSRRWIVLFRITQRTLALPLHLRLKLTTTFTTGATARSQVRQQRPKIRFFGSYMPTSIGSGIFGRLPITVCHR